MAVEKIEQFGRYEIVAEIGRGAMGVVFRARDPKIDRQVAIKTISLLDQNPDQETEFRERFFLEARAAGRLSHPGIVTIFDVGEDVKTRAPYIVMEYVPGETLQKLLARSHKLPFADALQLARELAEALDYAHAQHVIHRDIKPANIIIAEDGRAKITDFGIAKLNLSNFTISGNALGTPAYMAPEQLEGEQVDGRSDLFSVGVILYSMLTGHRPFQGNSTATVSFKVVNKDPVPPTAFDANFPPELDYVISRAIAKDPAQRYQRGREMALDLRNLLQGYLPRGIANPASAPNQTAHQNFALQAIQDVVPSVVEKVAKAKRNRILRSSSRWQTLLFTWKTATVAVVCLLAAAAWLISVTHPEIAPTSAIAAPNLPNVSPEAAPVKTKHKITTSRKSSSHTIHHVARNAPPPGIAEHPSATAAHPADTTQPASTAQPANAAHLKIKIEHHFTQARFSVWVDHQLAYRHELEGEVKKHLVLFHEVKGTESATLRVPAGDHQIKVEVSSRNGYDQSRTISADLNAQRTSLLRVKCSGKNEMSVNLK